MPVHLLPKLVLKELADNALDAGGTVRVGPARGRRLVRRGRRSRDRGRAGRHRPAVLDPAAAGVLQAAAAADPRRARQRAAGRGRRGARLGRPPGRGDPRPPAAICGRRTTATRWPPSSPAPAPPAPGSRSIWAKGCAAPMRWLGRGAPPSSPGAARSIAAARRRTGTMARPSSTCSRRPAAAACASWSRSSTAAPAPRQAGSPRRSRAAPAAA